MSWHCSRALVEAFSGATCSDGAPSVLSNTTHTLAAFYWPDKTTEHSRLSRFGMTCAPLTEGHGAELLTWFQADFLASPSAPRLEAEELPKTGGPTCSASSLRSSPVACLPRTSSASPLSGQLQLFDGLDTQPPSGRIAPPSWVARIAGRDGGWLPTPTAKANHDSPSMRKWPAYALYQDWLRGKTTPGIWEWMMGWPIGWTDLRPLGTGSFRQWRLEHGGILAESAAHD